LSCWPSFWRSSAGSVLRGLRVLLGQSIQKTINAADPGDTIVVSGTHREDVMMRKNGISLRGTGKAVILPPARVGSPCGPSGICVLGDVNFNNGEVNRYVKNVSISGFTVKNFRNEGVFAVGARDAAFMDNRLVGNGEYGIFALFSTGTKIFSNVARGSDEAGIYVGGSPHANAKVLGNETYGNLFGIFVPDALGGTIAGNRVHNNCLGVMFLADATGPSGNFEVKGNQVRDNTRSCPATEETPPISGVGISLFGARGVEVRDNHIAANVPSGPSLFSGGVAVVRGFGGTRRPRTTRSWPTTSAATSQIYSGTARDRVTASPRTTATRAYRRVSAARAVGGRPLAVSPCSPG
jgi:parallel beta-helix repeat protein